MLAAPGFIPDYPAEICNHVITFGYNQWQIHFLGQGFHAFQAVLVFQIGVNVGVIPQGTDLISMLAPVVNGIGSAVGTAAMN